MSLENSESGTPHRQSIYWNMNTSLWVVLLKISHGLRTVRGLLLLEQAGKSKLSSSFLFNNCITMWRLDASNIQGLPLLAASSQATQPWTLMQERETGTITLNKQWKEGGKGGENCHSSKYFKFMLNAHARTPQMRSTWNSYTCTYAKKLLTTREHWCSLLLQ